MQEQNWNELTDEQYQKLVDDEADAIDRAYDEARDRGEIDLS